MNKAPGGFRRRYVLNQRVYILPYVCCSVFYHLPLFGWFLYYTLSNDKILLRCSEASRISTWLFGAGTLHALATIFSLGSAIVTLCSPVYQKKRNERYFILPMYAIHIIDLAWSIYGQVVVSQDDIPMHCLEGLRASFILPIDDLSLFNLVLSSMNAFFWCLFTFLCGPHYHTSKAMFRKRWTSKCQCIFSALTCQRRKKDLDHVFDHLGELLEQLLTVQNNDGTYETVEMSDITFSLGLVRKAQALERKYNTDSPMATAPPVTASELDELSRYSILAKAIYGWPIYVCYNPFKCFNIFGCFSRPDQNQIIRHDNVLYSNRRSFIKHARIKAQDLVYLNCHNDVFQSPYAIVRDSVRKEMIITIRGTLSVTDLVTDGFAKESIIAAEDIPYKDGPVYTHEGILCTAKALFHHLQHGSRRQVFWDFVQANPDWKIVVTGHSLGAGIAAILTLFLRNLFPETKGFIYGPPPMFEDAVAEWSKCCLQTVVYGDDFVPRLSIHNVVRLRDEMLEQYSMVARNPLYKAYLSQPEAPAPQVRVNIASSIVLEMNDRKDRFHPAHKEYIDLDLPGSIVHIQPVKQARSCGCTVFCGQQRLTYSRQSAKAFKRILVNVRLLPDHMTHHYERDIQYCADLAAQDEKENQGYYQV